MCAILGLGEISPKLFKILVAKVKKNELKNMKWTKSLLFMLVRSLLLIKMDSVHIEAVKDCPSVILTLISAINLTI